MEFRLFPLLPHFPAPLIAHTHAMQPVYVFTQMYMHVCNNSFIIIDTNGTSRQLSSREPRRHETIALQIWFKELRSM